MKPSLFSSWIAVNFSKDNIDVYSDIYFDKDQILTKYYFELNFSSG